MPADTKISDLTAATTVGDTDLIPIVQGGTTKRATQNQVCTKIFDGSHVLAADFENRQLYGVNGTSVAVDWSNLGVMVFNSDVSAPNIITNPGSAPSVKVNDRQLIANDESTVALDWSDPTAFTAINLYTEGFSADANGHGLVSTMLPDTDPGFTGQFFYFAGDISNLTTFLAGGGQLVCISA